MDTSALVPRLNRYIAHRPTVPQVAFLLVPNEEAFYGGAVGGGKSEALLMAALQYADVPGYHAVIVRDSFAALEEAGALMERAKGWLLRTDATYSASERIWRFPSGASLSFRPLKDEGDERSFMGAEYQFIGIDELTLMTEGQYRFLHTRLRRPADSKLPLRMRSTGMPHGPGIEWVKRRFVDEGAANERIFIPSRLEDNPFLDTESYERSLSGLDPVTRAQIRDGDWSIRPEGGLFKASYFRYWRPAEGAYEFEGCLVRSSACPRFVTVDLAVSTKTSADYTVAGVWALTPDGALLLLHLERQRLEGPDQVPMLRRIHERWHPGVIAIESSGYQLTLIQEARRTGLPIQELHPDRDKVSRAWVAAARMEGGDVYLPSGAAFLEAFEAELLLFPKGRHDDQVDVLSYAAVVAAELAAPDEEVIVYFNGDTGEFQLEPWEGVRISPY